MTSFINVYVSVFYKSWEFRNG